MTYAGIDYGLKRSNIDTKTGIRFGVIPAHLTGDYWYDSAQPEYGNFCPKCGNEPKSGKPIIDMLRCPSCHKKLNPNWDFDNSEPLYNSIDDGEYKAHDDEYGDIFILSSPYFTYAQFCSPCAPGACHLASPLDEKIEDNRCYCFGHDFFPDNKAPYRVFSVETKEEILP